MRITVKLFALTFPLSLLSAIALADEKQLVPFKVVGTDQTSAILLVGKDTSPDQYTDLVKAIACARKAGTLQQLGIPPTTLQGKKGPYAVMQIYIFNDSTWATVEKIKKWVDADQGNPFSAQFGQKVQAYYYYTILSDQEQASLGFADGGRPFSRTYKSLTPISAEQCSSAKYVPAGASDVDELKTFLESDFAKKYGIHQTDKWALKTGGQNISFKSDTLPTVNLAAEQSQKSLVRFSMTFNIGYPIGQPELDILKGLADSVLSKDAAAKAFVFAKSNIEKPIKEKKDPNNPYILSMTSYPSLNLKGLVIRAGKHGPDLTFIIEKEAKL